MTEQEWLTGQSVVPLRMHAMEVAKRFRGDPRRRKARLFGCACCRRLWEHITDERSRKAVEAAEAFADGSLDKVALGAARREAAKAARQSHKLPQYPGYGNTPEDAAQIASNQSLNDVLVACTARCLYVAVVTAKRPLHEEDAEQARLIRDIFGNPFRPVAVAPGWRTSDVVSLATGIYQDRAFDHMPILGDALEDAGCDNGDILNHCREPGEHVRGCWVTDLLLGKM